MIRAYDVAAVRAAEQSAMAGLPEGALMQRAAAGLATAVLRVLAGAGRPAYGARVVLLVGPGDNGGDALWAGARLAARGARVDALLVADRAHEAGLGALRAAGGWVHPPGENAVLAAAHVVVDGLLGIGGRPGLTGAAEALVLALPPAVPVVAVDLPSGVDPDSGELAGTHIKAAVTVTFGAVKPALLLPPASYAAGRVELVDIGLDLPTPILERLEPDDLAALWPIPGTDDDKYRRGVLRVIAGGTTYTGAAVLCTGAAVRAGAGMVRYVGPSPSADLVRARWPEVVFGEGRVQAAVVGPGLEPDGDGSQWAAAQSVLATDLPCVVDAGALALVSARWSAPTLLTPHAGELARLLQARGEDVQRAEVEAAPLRYARRAAELTGATVLLKGAATLVVSPHGSVRSQAGGPHWLATAGSGDVLAGIAGALLAAGLSPLDAGTLAVGVHGAAGQLASEGGPVSASSVLEAVPAAIRRVLCRRASAGCCAAARQPAGC